MYPIRVKIKEGTLDIKEYDFNRDNFIGSNDKTYTIEDIEYFIIPKNEMQKILESNSKKNIKNVQNEKKTKDIFKMES